MDKVQKHNSLKLSIWGKILLQKLIIAQLVKKFSAFYETQMFITVFTGACHWSLT
jgi:hypothetical protein